MQAALTIEQLVQMPNFGVNKVRNIALANLEQSVYESYTLTKNNNTLRVKLQRPHPVEDVKDKGVTQFVELDRNQKGLVEDETLELLLNTFFQKIDDAEFLEHGELNVVAFEAAFAPLYEAKLNYKLSYGSNPTLLKLTYGARSISTMAFTDVKEGKTRKHSVTLKRIDVDKDLNKIVIIPRNLFTTYREFMKIFNVALGEPEDSTRFFLKDDPTAFSGDAIELFIDPDDFVYSGSIKVQLPWGGDEVRVIDRAIAPSDDEEPEEPEDEELEDDEENGEGEDPPEPNEAILVLSNNKLTIEFTRPVTLNGVPLADYDEDAAAAFGDIFATSSGLEALMTSVVTDNASVITTSTQLDIFLQPGWITNAKFEQLDTDKDGHVGFGVILKPTAFVSVDNGPIDPPDDVAILISSLASNHESVETYTPEDYQGITIQTVFIYPG